MIIIPFRDPFPDDSNGPLQPTWFYIVMTCIYLAFIAFEVAIIIWLIRTSL